MPPWLEPLPPGVGCAVWRRSGGPALFTHGGAWLHPLFALDEWLAGPGRGLPRAELALRDRIIGRGAAYLVWRMGLGEAAAELASERGFAVLARAGIPHSAVRLVPRIDCMTEEALGPDWDPTEAWRFLDARRRAALVRQAAQA